MDMGPVQELVQNGIITELNILQTTAAEAGTEVLEKIETVPDEAVKAVPRQLAYRLAVMPPQSQGQSPPGGPGRSLQFRCHRHVEQRSCASISTRWSPRPSRIELALKRHYGSASEMVHSLIGNLQRRQAPGQGHEGSQRGCERRWRSGRRRAHHPPGTIS